MRSSPPVWPSDTTADTHDPRPAHLAPVCWSGLPRSGGIPGSGAGTFSRTTPPLPSHRGRGRWSIPPRWSAPAPHRAPGGAADRRAPRGHRDPGLYEVTNIDDAQSPDRIAGSRQHCWLWNYRRPRHRADHPRRRGLILWTTHNHAAAVAHPHPRRPCPPPCSSPGTAPTRSASTYPQPTTTRRSPHAPSTPTLSRL